MADDVLQIIEPWTMPYLEFEQEFIDELRAEIGPGHPLYRKRVYVTALRKDPYAVIFETASKEPIYVWVQLTRSGRRSTRKGFPKTEVLPNRQAIRELMQKDHDEWIEWCKRNGCYDTLAPAQTADLPTPEPVDGRDRNSKKKRL